MKFSGIGVGLLCAMGALGASCQSSSQNEPLTASISPLASPAAQWTVGNWIQSADGIGTESTPPLRHGRMQFQVNPPMFVWEGFRSVGVEGDPNFPGRSTAAFARSRSTSR